jgi:hypothetical protein
LDAKVARHATVVYNTNAFVNSFYVKDFCRFPSAGGHYQVEMSMTDQELLRERAEL